MIGADNRFTSAFGRAVLDAVELAHVIARAVDAGFAIVLCRPGTKQPVCTLTTPTARNKADKAAQAEARARGVERWDRVRHECGMKHALEGDGNKARTVYRRVQAQHEGVLNIAVVPGRSRMVVVDVDTEDQLRAFRDHMRENVDLTVRSPGTADGAHSGGGHIWYEVPQDWTLPSGNKWVAPEGWTVMWGEAYALVPPSRRPEGPYVLECPDVEPLPRAAGELIWASASIHPREAGPKAEGDPVDVWAAEVPWTTLLTVPDQDHLCWDFTGKFDQCGCPIWTAPGGRADPKSATAHEVGCGKVDTSTGHGPLHLWTDAPPPFLNGQRNYTKLQYVAARDHGGNVAAAMRAVGIEPRMEAVPGPIDLEIPEKERPFTRIVDLSGWLDGTRVPPVPSTGAQREDGQQMLYPGKWHTVIGLTTAGKSWFSLWHAKAVLEDGGCVAYVHFEESDPGGTLNRLIQLGVPVEAIRERFVWLDNSRMWKASDMGQALAELEEQRGHSPRLLILDGLNAGASRQGWKLNDAETVTLYRGFYVAAAVKRGAAVLSLGHPVKDRTRQDEIHGFGSTAWLDEVDGVSFRLVAGQRPIRKGHRGSSWVSVVKDRAGGLTEACEIEQGKSEVWYSLGEFVLDDAAPEVIGETAQHTTGAWMTAPRKPEEKEPGMDRIGELAQRIITWLTDHGGRYEGKNALMDGMRADSIGFREEDVEPALIRLEEGRTIEREPFRKGRSRAGWLVPELGDSQ